jgi:hypothetical protein
MSNTMSALKGLWTIRLAPIGTAVMVTLLVVSTLGLIALVTVWTALDLLDASRPVIWSAETVAAIIVAIPCIRFGISVWQVERGVHS